MPESKDTENAMVFAAKNLSRRISQRTNRNYTVDQILKWAKKCAAEQSAICSDPVWWIMQAIEDMECLDAAANMLGGFSRA